MKKIFYIIFIIILFIATFFYLGKTALVSTTGNTFAEKIAKKIPEKHKEWIKNIFFKSNTLKVTIQNKDKEISKLRYIANTKNNIVIKNYNKIYFEKPFPLIEERKDYSLLMYQTKFLTNGKNEFAVASGYIDIFKDSLIIATGDGLLFNVDLISLSDPKSGFEAKVINSNIKELIATPGFFKKSYMGIKDILIKDDLIFLSFSNEVKENCYNTGILKGVLNLNYIKFENISLSTAECAKKDRMDNALQGGRIVEYDDDEILFTHGDWYQDKKAQDKKSIFGKVIKLNYVSGEYEIISYGHRNPQGMVYLKKENLIFETEHGPIGGDEINVIDLNNIEIEKNYGWPIASYGLGTQNSATSFTGKKKYKSHSGYIEPIKYWVPSIGISEIVDVPNKFIDGKDNSYNFFISTLGTKVSEGDLSFHHVKVDKNTKKVLSSEVINIQERIRDAIYYEKINSIIMFIESDRMRIGGPSIAVFKKKTN